MSGFVVSKLAFLSVLALSASPDMPSSAGSSPNNPVGFGSASGGYLDQAETAKIA